MARYGRISEADMAAFKTEAAALRKQLNAIRVTRRGYWEGKKKVDVALLRKQLAELRRRLDYWKTVIVVDDNKIRSPVAIWDRWNKLFYMVEFNESDLTDISASEHRRNP